LPISSVAQFGGAAGALGRETDGGASPAPSIPRRRRGPWPGRSWGRRPAVDSVDSRRWFNTPLLYRGRQKDVAGRYGRMLCSGLLGPLLARDLGRRGETSPHLNPKPYWGYWPWAALHALLCRLSGRPQSSLVPISPGNLGGSLVYRLGSVWRDCVVGEVGLEPTKASASGFTVRPLCRSGHSPVHELQVA
jgi:hypothetical protein